MIFGDCPYCNEPMTIIAPEDMPFPVMAKIDCEHCGKTFVEKFSRIDPQAYRLEDVTIDEEKHSIKLKEQ